MILQNLPLNQIEEAIWEIGPSFKRGMVVPARLIATRKLLEGMDDAVFEQLTNVACLPGLVGYVWVMADAHSGYGAPIGAVFASDPDNGGVISPGAVGYDINCGIRLIRTNLTFQEVQPKLPILVDRLFTAIPTGVGARGALKLSRAEFKQILKKGVGWCRARDWASSLDQERCEEGGCLSGADPEKVSDRAFRRGIEQVGTLGSGNHFLEIQVVDQIYDQNLAEKLGILAKDQVVFMIHCGSRGLGHQIASDYLRVCEKAMVKYQIQVPDQQLASAPFLSPAGNDYFGAMASAVNMAFANRQVITHFAKEVFTQTFSKSIADLGMELVYDVAHNIAKLEEHGVDRGNKEGGIGKREEGSGNREVEIRKKKVGGRKRLLVHRKGATRSFGPGRKEVPEEYRQNGQPVIIGGSMETGSYLLLGTETAMRQTFGSTAHGAGRNMSRTQARRQVQGEKLQQEMRRRGIYVRGASWAGLAEEAGLAYKDINEVVKAVSQAGISRPLVRFRPIGNIKG